MHTVCFESVVTLEGRACHEVLYVHAWHGVHRALRMLTAWHCPGSHPLVAAPVIAVSDDCYSSDGYVIALNHARQHVCLWYRLDATDCPTTEPVN